MCLRTADLFSRAKHQKVRKNGKAAVKNNMAIKKKNLNTELPYDPALPWLNLIPERIETRDLNTILYTRAHSSKTHNS